MKGRRSRAEGRQSTSEPGALLPECFPQPSSSRHVEARLSADRMEAPTAAMITLLSPSTDGYQSVHCRDVIVGGPVNDKLLSPVLDGNPNRWNGQEELEGRQRPRRFDLTLLCTAKNVRCTEFQ